MLRSLITVMLLLSVAAQAEDEAQRKAREELEKQLSQMVGKQPTKVRIDYESLDEPMYKLDDASFELDGKSLPRPSLDELTKEGVHLVWNGDASPGKHLVAARLVFRNEASPVVSEEGGHVWKVQGTVSFELQEGIEVRVKVTPQRDNAQKDVAKRFQVRLPATPVMLAQMDDGKMPEPPPKPKLEVADAGATVVVASAAELAAEKKRLAAEEKKRKAEEAKEAKRLAAEEKKRKAEEAKEAKRLAAEEKKRKAEEAKEAKRLAATGKTPPVLVAEAQVDAGAPEVVDAGPAVAEVVDAGPPVVAEVVDAGPPPAVAATEPPAEEGLPLGLIAAGGGAVVLLLLIVVVARRRSRLPKLDD
ncbi:MAG: hypothetical protein IT380_27080 [Myxococcales bacterium]|nr:hypothetical protein [Myxococcales bacterium]